MKILIAEDDVNILNGLSEILEAEGFHVIKAKNGQEALEQYRGLNPDFVCLDVMMPDISGYEVCRKIREADQSTPVIFLSAKSEEIDKVLGLELGADDYIVKPFGVHEVVARIRAVARRVMNRREPTRAEEFFEMDDLKIYPAKFQAVRGDEVIELSLRNTKILELLYQNKNMPVTRDQMLDYCWGAHIMPESRTLDQHISKLRKLVENDPANPKIIETVHKVGYRYSEE